MPININGGPQIEGQRFSHHPPSDVIMLIMVHGRQLKEILVDASLSLKKPISMKMKNRRIDNQKLQ